MKMVTLEIDGKEVKAEEGKTILDAAKQAEIDIPTLCHHEELEPYGACRICSVEIERKGRTRIVASCGYPVEEGLKVITKSPKIIKIRKTILELISLKLGDDMRGEIRALASEYNADVSRFISRTPVESTGCILCGLCVRRCSEILSDNAIGFVGRGVNRRIVLFPEKIQNCSTCRYCYEICPSGKIPSTGPVGPIPYIDEVLTGRK